MIDSVPAALHHASMHHLNRALPRLNLMRVMLLLVADSFMLLVCGLYA